MWCVCYLCAARRLIDVSREGFFLVGAADEKGRFVIGDLWRIMNGREGRSFFVLVVLTALLRGEARAGARVCMCVWRIDQER